MDWARNSVARAGHEHLLEHTSETMRPIIEGLFAELTLLGFIGLTLFLVFKMEWLKVISDKFYGDEKARTRRPVLPGTAPSRCDQRKRRRESTFANPDLR